jgi:chitinase
MYTDCNGLLTQSASPFPGSSLFELASAGWPLSKLVIGKPASLYVHPSLRSQLDAQHKYSGNANNGYIDPNDLAACIGQAKARGWNGGVMSWQVG